MIDPNRRVQVYFNLHRKVYSVRQGGKVVAHVREIALRDVNFLVGAAGRDRVRATGQKTVHAYVTGYVVEGGLLFRDGRSVTYNPLKYDTFVTGSDKQPIFESDKAVLFAPEGQKPEVWAV